MAVASFIRTIPFDWECVQHWLECVHREKHSIFRLKHVQVQNERVNYMMLIHLDLVVVELLR